MRKCYVFLLCVCLAFPTIAQVKKGDILGQASFRMLNDELFYDGNAHPAESNKGGIFSIGALYSIHARWAIGGDFGYGLLQTNDGMMLNISNLNSEYYNVYSITPRLRHFYPLNDRVYLMGDLITRFIWAHALTDDDHPGQMLSRLVAQIFGAPYPTMNNFNRVFQWELGLVMGVGYALHKKVLLELQCGFLGITRQNRSAQAWSPGMDVVNHESSHTNFSAQLDMFTFSMGFTYIFSKEQK